MADHELNILVRAKGALQAARDIGKVDTAVGRLGATASRGVRTAARNTAIIGAGIAVGIGAGVKSGIESLATLEDAQTSVSGAIKQVGLDGQVTAAQVSTWANEIERSVERAFDDKAITQAAANLIRFGKVTPANLRPAMEVMTDLAAKTGSVESASTLLAKALADPEKAAGKLARQGIVLTKEQQKQIKSHMKVGDVAAAQGVILDELAKTTAGAAKASAGPYRDSLNILADVTEDAQRALGEGFLPVLMKVADLLSSEMAKPSTMANIREFGQGLASGLDDLIDIARNLPWEAIGTSLKVAGAGAKTVLGIFTSMPPWVQTAVLTGWGLNKLTGGALGSIVGEVGKGLIKGVLGMSAGVVNINAGVVNGAGGVGGAAGKAGGLAGAASKALSIGAIVAGVAGVIATQQEVSGQSTSQAAEIKAGLDASIAGKTIPQLQTALAGINQGITDIESNPLHALVQGEALTTLKAMQKQVTDQLARTDKVKAAQVETKRETSRGLALTKNASQTAGQVGASATRTSAASITAAIRANRPIITVNVTGSSVESSQTRNGRNGGSNADRDSDQGAAGHGGGG